MPRFGIQFWKAGLYIDINSGIGAGLAIHLFTGNPVSQCIP
jgi:hypothetical protein